MPIILIRGNLASYSSKSSPFRVMVSGLKREYLSMTSSSSVFISINKSSFLILMLTFNYCFVDVCWGRFLESFTTAVYLFTRCHLHGVLISLHDK